MENLSNVDTVNATGADAWPWPKSEPVQAAKPKRIRKTKVVKPIESEPLILSGTLMEIPTMHSVFGASQDMTIEYIDDTHFREIKAEPKPSIDAEQIVDSLIDSQVSTDSQESAAVLAMIDAVRSGAGDVKAFVNCYAARAIGRMSEKSIPVRKSNLKGVLSYALESEVFAGIVRTDMLGLQAAYALRAEMLKGDKPEESQAEPEVSDEACDVPVDAMSVLVQQLKNAISAAEEANRDDVAEDVREILSRVLGATVTDDASDLIEA